MNNSNFDVLSFNELSDIEGGTFWGVCSGVATCIAGTATVVGGIGASTLGVGIPMVILGAATYSMGIHTIVSNM